MGIILFQFNDEKHRLC